MPAAMFDGSPQTCHEHLVCRAHSPGTPFGTPRNPVWGEPTRPRVDVPSAALLSRKVEGPRFPGARTGCLGLFPMEGGKRERAEPSGVFAVEPIEIGVTKGTTRVSPRKGKTSDG